MWRFAASRLIWNAALPAVIEAPTRLSAVFFYMLEASGMNLALLVLVNVWLNVFGNVSNSTSVVDFKSSTISVVEFL